MRPLENSRLTLVVYLAMVRTGRIVREHTLHRVLHGRGEHFAVGNVVLARARHDGHSLDGEAQIGARPCDMYGVGFRHHRAERLHAAAHRGVIHAARVDDEVAKLRVRHPRLLRLSHGRPIEQHPFAVVEYEVGPRFADARAHLHGVGAYSCKLGVVFFRGDLDIGVGVGHRLNIPCRFDVLPLLSGAFQQPMPGLPRRKVARRAARPFRKRAQ